MNSKEYKVLSLFIEPNGYETREVPFCILNQKKIWRTSTILVIKKLIRKTTHKYAPTKYGFMYEITTEGYSAYFSYHDSHTWTAIQFIFGQVLIPIAIGVLSAIATLISSGKFLR